MERIGSDTPVSLFEHSYYQANRFKDSLFNKIVLATDYSRDFIKEAIDYGEYELFEREDVADNEPAINYINGVIEHFKLSDYDDICLLQPTCPLRSLLDISEAVWKYWRDKDKYKTLISVTAVSPLQKLYKLDENQMFNITAFKDLTCETHDAEKIYMRNSSIYIFNVGFFKEKQTIFVPETNYYEMPWHRSVDINEWEDLIYSKKLIEKKGA